MLEGMVVVNKRGVIELVNSRMLSMFGYSEQELIGQRIEILGPDNLKSKHDKHREKYIHNPANRRKRVGFKWEKKIANVVSDWENYTDTVNVDLKLRDSIKATHIIL